jgi:SH3-like domain-containing protein
MISPGLTASLSALAILFGTAFAVSAETTGVLRPLARPDSLSIPAPPASPAEEVTQVSAVAEPESAAPADEPVIVPAGPSVGAVTSLPVPRYVSLKTGEGNVRRGPSLSHRIDWVFTREDMPLQITAEYGHWRRVVDSDGLGGWVHYSLVSGTRTVMVNQDMLPLRARPDEGASEVALLEQGVIARLGECNADWCRISSGGYRGWTPKTALWGVDADEIRE